MKGLLVASLLLLGSVVLGQPVTKPMLPPFEVASIKLSHSEGDRGIIAVPPDGDRVSVVNVPMARILGLAFGMERGDLVLGVPEWTRTDRWDIEGKVSPADLPAFHALTFKQKQAMLQPLLAERCRLQAHMTEETAPVYALLVAKGGVKMRPAKPKEADWDLTQKHGEIHGRAVPMEALMYALTFVALDRQVLNRTGLAGVYDFDLLWTPGDEAAADGAADGSRPSIFTALQEQLGLRLMPVKAKVPALLVEHIERPSAN